MKNMVAQIFRRTTLKACQGNKCLIAIHGQLAQLCTTNPGGLRVKSQFSQRNARAKWRFRVLEAYVNVANAQLNVWKYCLC